MNISLSSLLGETSAGLTLAVAAMVAAYASYALMRKASKGRARSAVAFLFGLAAGLSATAWLARLIAPHADPGSVLAPGLLGAFFGPFAGMLRAKWEGPPKRRRSRGWIRLPD